MSTPGSTHATRASRVDVEHPVHLGRDDHERVVERRRAAGEPGAAAARDERPPVPARDAHRGRDLVGRSGPAHGDRACPRSTPASRAYSASSSGSALARGPDRAQRADRRGARRAAMSRDVTRMPRSPTRRPTEYARTRMTATYTRVGHDPRPRQGTQAVADRRDVPHVVVALHLRPGLPGRAHRAGARARRRAAARTARTSPRRRSRSRSRSSPKQLGDDEWQFEVGRHEEAASGRRSARTSGAPASHEDACVFLNRPDFEAGPGCALHLHAIEHGQALQRDQADGVLAAPAAHVRPRRGRRRRSRRCSPSSAATAGAKAARSSPGGAPRRRRRSPAHEPVYQSMETELRLMLGDDVYEEVVEVPATRGIAAGRRRCRTRPRCQVSLGRTRIRRP